MFRGQYHGYWCLDPFRLHPGDISIPVTSMPLYHMMRDCSYAPFILNVEKWLKIETHIFYYLKPFGAQRTDMLFICWPLYHPRSKSYWVVFAPWILEILIVTDTLCEGNPSMTDRFPSQCASVMANIGPFPNREIKALSPTECNTSGRRRNM